MNYYQIMQETLGKCNSAKEILSTCRLWDTSFKTLLASEVGSTRRTSTPCRVNCGNISSKSLERTLYKVNSKQHHCRCLFGIQAASEGNLSAIIPAPLRPTREILTSFDGTFKQARRAGFSNFCNKTPRQGKPKKSYTSRKLF